MAVSGTIPFLQNAFEVNEDRKWIDQDFKFLFGPRATIHVDEIKEDNCAGEGFLLLLIPASSIVPHVRLS